jgi:hypothetical protein
MRWRAVLGVEPSLVGTLRFHSLSQLFTIYVMRPLLQHSVRPPLLKGWLLQQLLAVTQITAGFPAAPYAPPFAEAARLPFTGTPHGSRLMPR